MKFISVLAVVLVLIYLLMGLLRNDPTSASTALSIDEKESKYISWGYGDRATIIMMEDRFEAIENILHKYQKNCNISSRYVTDTFNDGEVRWNYRKEFKNNIVLNSNYVKSINCSIGLQKKLDNDLRLVEDYDLTEIWVLELDTFCFDIDDEFENLGSDISCSLDYKYFLEADSISIRLWLDDSETQESKSITKQELFFLLKKCGIIPFSDPAEWFSKNKHRYLQKEFQDSVLDKHKLLMPTRYIHGR